MTTPRRVASSDAVLRRRLQATFTPSRQTTRNRPAVRAVNWTTAILACSDFKFSVGDSLELSGIQFRLPIKRTRQGQNSFVVSGVAV